MDQKSKSKIILSIEIFVVVMFIFTISYGILQVSLSNFKIHIGALLSLSLLAFILVGIPMLLDIIDMIFSQIKIMYKDTPLYILPSKYCLLPTKEHLPQRKSKLLQIIRHSDNTTIINNKICFYHA